VSNRYFEYVDSRGNTWQSIVEQFEYGYWVREGYKPPFSGLWHHFPVPESAKFETSAEARAFAERMRKDRMTDDES
jgi:hypothetical protein